MDQFASVCGEENRLLQLDCRSLEWSGFDWPENMPIVVADTNIRRKLNTSEYNQRCQDCEEAIRLLEADLPAIRTLRDAGFEDFEKLCWKLPPRVEKRARHVIEEIVRTQKARSFLASQDIDGFGRLMNDCHESLRDLYEVSSFELDSMVEIAQSLDGCFGSRLTGAGFGGCTVSIVENWNVERFVVELKRCYSVKTGQVVDVHISRPSTGAGLIG